MNGIEDMVSLRERIRRLIRLQRQVNEQAYRFSQETDDREVQRVITEVIGRGSENIQELAKLLAVKCGT